MQLKKAKERHFQIVPVMPEEEVKDYSEFFTSFHQLFSFSHMQSSQLSPQFSASDYMQEVSSYFQLHSSTVRRISS